MQIIINNSLTYCRFNVEYVSYLAALVHMVANECASMIGLALYPTFFQGLVNLLYKWS